MSDAFYGSVSNDKIIYLQAAGEGATLNYFLPRKQKNGTEKGEPYSLQ